MGGLIGGSFASGMDADELEAMLNGLNWDEIFGSSSFDFKNIRRKNDARAYPSRLEFGIKRGIVPPTSLNNGEQVELLLGRIAAPYYDLKSFDELPTPFRAVAVDLVSATEVVLNQRLAGAGDARDDVAAADLSAGGGGRPRAGGRRRHEQRARRRGEGDGRGPGGRRQRRRAGRLARASATRCSASPGRRSTR